MKNLDIEKIGLAQPGEQYLYRGEVVEAVEDDEAVNDPACYECFVEVDCFLQKLRCDNIFFRRVKDDRSY